MSEPRRIDPLTVYDLQSGREAVGMAKGCLPREIRLGRLRAAKRGGKILILGEWLIQWVREGEVSRRRETSTVSSTVAANADGG